MLPAAVDGRTPVGLRLASGIPYVAGAPVGNAVVLVRNPGVLVVSGRLSGVVPNSYSFPLHPVGVGFLDSLRNATPLDQAGAPLPTAIPRATPSEGPTPSPEASPTEEEAEPSGFIPRE
jgi:hypothetical protein